MNGQLWIEPVGDIIIARTRGLPTAELLRDCQERILELVKDTDVGRILHDCLEMETPDIDVPISQWKLDQETSGRKLRRAIVVPNTKLAYLARLAFSDQDVKIFYNDMASALSWLVTNEAKLELLRPKSGH